MFILKFRFAQILAGALAGLSFFSCGGSCGIVGFSCGDPCGHFGQKNFPLRGARNSRSLLCPNISGPLCAIPQLVKGPAEAHNASAGRGLIMPRPAEV